MIKHETSAACGVIKDKTSAEYRTMTHESSGTCRSMYNNVTCASITISYTTERENYGTERRTRIEARRRLSLEQSTQTSWPGSVRPRCDRLRSETQNQSNLNSKSGSCTAVTSSSVFINGDFRLFRALKRTPRPGFHPYVSGH